MDCRSAELNNVIQPLADFGSDTFTDASAAAGSESGSISAFPYTQIDLTPHSGIAASPSALGEMGSSFTDVDGVPEPSTLALLGCGVAVGIVVGARQRRRA